METCQSINSIHCSLGDILQRITPIEYIDNVLVIHSPMSVSTSLHLDGVSIEGSNGVLELPQGTTVGGVPLLSPLYIGDIYQLPSKTNIDGFRINDGHFFNFYSARIFASGSYINNFQAGPSGDYPWFFPFFVPQNCVLTSLRFSMAIGSSGTSTITNATSTIYTWSLSGVVTNTGISTVIASCPVNTRTYAETTFQYPVLKGTSIGIKVQYTGSASATITPFAVLGYKFP